MHRSETVERPAPPWLVAEDYEERQLGVLKSGKEAEVFLVERRSTNGTCLLAHKRYRPRNPRKGELLELGFSKGTIYHNDKVYRAGWYLKSRDQRAVDHGTRHGHEIAARLWPANELTMLQRAWEAGASVPYPVEGTEDGLLMEFIAADGIAGVAAPRLVDARLSRDELPDAWRQLIESLRLLTRAGLVHADLSVYNLLWAADRDLAARLVIIDFPQAVEAVTNPQAPDLLHRDIRNVAAWFARRGLAVDAEATFADLLTEMW